MPQATDELAAEWPGMDEEAINYLQAQGYKLTRRYEWKPPTPEHEPTDREVSAIVYLMDEWDFGGLETRL